MASIASLTVDMALNTAAFAASAKKVQADVSSMKATIEGFSGSLESARGFLEKFGIALGIRELVEFGKGAVETAANLGEMAERAGLTVDQLQGLEFAALKSGEGIDGIDTAVARLTRSIGEAAEGNKKAIDTFSKLHIGVLDANNQVRSTADVFMAAARAIAVIPDPAKRATAEVALFGKSGQSIDGLITKLGDGRLSLDDAAKAAKEAGFSFSEELVEGAKAAESQIELLRRRAEVFAVTWGGEFIKALQGTPNAIDDALKGLQPLADFLNHLIDLETEYGKTHRSLLDILNGGANANSDNPLLHPLTDAQAGLNGGLLPAGGPHPPNPTVFTSGGSHNPPSTEAVDQIQKVIAALKLQLAALGQTDLEQKIYADLAKAGTTANTAAGKQIADLVTQIYNQKDAVDALNDLDKIRADQAQKQQEADARTAAELKAMADAAEQVQTNVKQQISDNGDLITALGQSAHAYDVETQFIQIRNAALGAGHSLVGSEVAQARANAETLVNQADALQRLQQNAANVQSAMEAVGTEFVNAATGVETWGDAAKAVLGDVLKLIVQLLEQQLVLSFGGAAAGGGGGSGILSSIFSGIGSFLHFATGGDVSAGMPITVGEHGQETFIPHMDGTIMPHNFAGATGGGSVTITPYYDFRGSSVSQADVQRAVEQGNKKTYSAVFAAMNRGGPEAKASGRRAHR